MNPIESIFESYKNDVYRLALSFTRSTQEAEDVCQTVFLKLLEAPRITPGKERAWLMQVTANQCRNLLKSAWWRKTAPMEDSAALTASEDSGIFQAVMSLPPKYRVVIYLHYYEEYTTQETADLLHISQSAVTTRLSRAREMLRAQLKEASL